MELTLQILAAVVVIGLLWVAFQPRYLFVVSIHQGVPRVARGKVTSAFVQEVHAACREADLSAGWIGGVRDGKHVRLRFSRQIPVQCRQRLRNLWDLVR